jgi:hypothetical protein
MDRAEPAAPRAVASVLPHLRRDLLAVFVDDDLVVVDPGAHRSHVLQGGAVAVWAALELHGGTACELAAAVGTVTGIQEVDSPQFAEQVGRALDAFADLGLLETDPTTGSEQPTTGRARDTEPPVLPSEPR